MISRIVIFLTLATVAFGGTTYNTTFVNKSNFAQQMRFFKLDNEGNTISSATFTLNAGASTVRSYTVNEGEYGNHEQLVYGYIEGHSKISGGGSGEWVEVSSGRYHSETTINNEIWIFASVVTPEEKLTLWHVADTTLTANLFREGIDKVVYAAGQGAIDAPAGSGGTGSGMTVEEFAATNAEGVAALQKYYYDNPKTAPTFSTTAETNTALSQVTSALNSKESPNIASNVTANASSSMRIIIGDYANISYDPADHPWLSDFLNFFKASVSWLITLWITLYTWRTLAQLMKEAAVSPQAKGNAAIAGTGGQATSLIAAILITALIVALPAAYWAVSDTATAFGADLTNNPFAAAAQSGSGPLAIGAYLFFYSFPVQVALSAGAAYLVISRAAMLMLSLVQTAIRFIVP